MLCRGDRQDSGERRERTRRAESWLGVPTKQNADERRARLGHAAVKRSRCPAVAVAKRTTLSPFVTIGIVREKATHGAKDLPHFFGGVDGRVITRAGVCWAW